MDASERLLSYCANVHPAETLAEVLANIHRYAAPLRRRLAGPLGLGLWLPASVIHEIQVHSESIDNLKNGIREADVFVETANAFPFGNFHAKRVKEDVYLPDWTTVERRDYTCRVADVLSELLPENRIGSLSTVPLAWGRFHPFGDDTSIYRQRLVETALYLESLTKRSGKHIRLAIEPEPLCVLETTNQAISFFQEIWRATDGTRSEQAVRNHLGLCYDICHQAVEYEDVPRTMARLEAAEVPIAKVHLSCALELQDPSDTVAREELATFAEERYLHQTFGSHPSGRILKVLDLDRSWTMEPGDEWTDCRSWRIHFHVPIHKGNLSRLATTQLDLQAGIETAAQLTSAPTLEVETYTWNVLANQRAEMVESDLVDGLAAEIQYAQQIISAVDKG